MIRCLCDSCGKDIPMPSEEHLFCGNRPEGKKFLVHIYGGRLSTNGRELHLCDECSKKVENKLLELIDWSKVVY